MLDSLTAKQFRGWEHIQELDAIVDTELRMDYRVASVVQILHNINRGKDNKALPLKDFVLKFGEPDDINTTPIAPNKLMAKLKLIAAMYANNVEPPKVIDTTPVEQDALERARKAMS